MRLVPILVRPWRIPLGEDSLTKGSRSWEATPLRGLPRLKWRRNPCSHAASTVPQN
ncbi:hypothetical protein [Nostoc sp.]|uniref:hypothetical protein n=1 Tax=Nostoc sp. TaxID=1180 RepID=UPI002FF6B370